MKAAGTPWKVEEYENGISETSIRVVDETGEVIADNEPYYPTGITRERADIIVEAVNAYDDHSRRVTELLEANNRYQQEARDARIRASKAEAALAVLDVAFCMRHGSFPVDRVTSEQRLFNDSMKVARAVTGDDYNARVALAEATLAAFRGEVPVDTTDVDPVGLP